ncbi:2-amino-3-carboxymuconate-6-semialdehyde decarboxylase [Penicillium maclennaniae]|uniref:2-amino-3-carboxymuconate-6-semialdehyde decarboxylase n=1 Tax=Penicillium maclennaniae TaxID=1343394 RepID=UPI0025402C6A|nr:2-amino-3-carboxymuconate-6-semialdehyde decarboxylase [Penicillium maclennaniae]KAJ5678044.1 2-amino-3-carboxymuconate-6-semialdehyde decarboxylase [Penicillium maclennaniae]
MPNPTVVDVHTHVYPPAYMAMLRARKKVPYVHDPANSATPRLIILSSDDDSSIPIEERGRPVDSSYYDINVKLAFMEQHGIDCSVNGDSSSSQKKLFAFGTLPLSASNPEVITNEIKRLKSLSQIRGVIMGTSGLGNGLDDPLLDPVWAVLEETQQMMFLHPHYGLPDEAFGGPETTNRYGHVLPLALGFPLETTIAVTRMLLSGVFDRFPKLNILLAHSGGTLPFLAGRIESCIMHERHFVANGGSTPGPVRSVWDTLQTNIYLDAVVYGTAGLKAAVAAAGGSADRLMFGTDHPFFPPLNEEDEKWASVTTNYKAIQDSFGDNKGSVAAVLGGNAARVLNLI